MRLFIKDCKRLAKKSEDGESKSKLQAKKHFRAGNADLARVHAENAIRHRQLARYYYTLLANAGPIENELKKQLSADGLSQYTQSIIQQFQRLKNDANIGSASNTAQEAIPVEHVNALLEVLSEDVQLDILKKLPNCGSTINSLESRLDSLRK